MTKETKPEPCSPRYATRRREERKTFGHELADIAERLGQPFMPWQRQVADVACELLPDGRPAYRTVFVTVPRQSGKTTLFVAWLVHRCLYWPRQPQRTVFTAQTGNDARVLWLDEIFPMLEASQLSPLIKATHKGMGNEAITFKTGSIIRLASTASSSGHGKTLHQAVLDEIWHDQDDRREQGLRPTMITQADAQILICSTAGTAESVVYNRKVQQGRLAVNEDRDSGIAYFEWSAPDDWEVDSPEETWYDFMPALGRTIGPDAIRSERDEMDAGEFKRAYGNRPTAGADLIFPPGVWRDAVSPTAKPKGRLRLGIDVAEDRSSGSVAVFGGGAVELLKNEADVEWIVPYVKDLRKRHQLTVQIDFGGPAGVLAKDLGLRRREKLVGRDVTQACAGLFDAIIERKVKFREDERLNRAVEGAVKKPLGDNWCWSRKGSLADVTPLWASTLAHYDPGHSGVVQPVR